jgi:hypothetical protein
VDLSMHGKKSLRVAVGLKPAHLPFLLTRMFMGYFGSVVRVFVRTMDHGWHHFSPRGPIAGELVGRDVDRQRSLPLQQLTKEAFGGTFVLALLQQDIQNITILVDCSPEGSALALNGHGDLIEIPEIAECSTGLSDPSCVVGPKLPTPLPHRFVRHDNSTLGKKVLDISKTQCESVVESNGVSNNVGWIPAAAVGR